MSDTNRRPKRSYIAIAVAMASGVLLFMLGIGFGIWFSMNFQIVPKGELADMLEESIAKDPALAGLLSAESLPAGPAMKKLLQGEAVDADRLVKEVLSAPAKAKADDAWATASPGGLARDNGPFKFRFTTGERLDYTVSTSITGEGFELLGDAPVKMNLDTGFSLTTDAVASDGTGELTMQFGEAKMSGEFMGAPIEMRHGPLGTELRMGGQSVLDGASLGLPQLDFLDTPVKMHIGSDGVVEQVSGAPGMEALGAQMPSISTLEFPESDLLEGAQWDSQVPLPIPGFDAPVTARMKNTFTGYRHIGDRLCAIVEQQIVSVDKNNSITTPNSALGPALGLGVPQFDLAGKNTVYFDVDNGQMVQSDMDLDMKLDIGQSLGLGGGMLDQLGAGLSDLLGGLPELEGLLPAPSQENKNLLDLDLKIKSRVSLLDTLSAEARGEMGRAQGASE